MKIPNRAVAGAVCLVVGLAASTVQAGPYSDAVLADGPIAYYRLEETAGTTAANIGSGAGIDATYVNIGTELNSSLIGQVGPRPGDNAGAFLIDGFETDNRSLFLSPTLDSAATDDTFPRAEVSVPDGTGTSPLALSGGFTLEAWIKHSGDTIGAGNHEGILGRYRQTQNGPARSYVLYYDSTAETVAGTGPGLGIAYSPDGNFQASNSVEFLGPITVGEWTHVAAVFEPFVRMELYVNGISIGEVGGVIGGPLYTGEGDFWIGQQFNGDDAWSFQGNIDEVAVFDRALSDAEIAAHFAAATGDTPLFFTWNQNSSGDWNEATNWTLDTIPNSNSQVAILGSAINAPRVVYTNSAVTVKGIRFASSNQYAVSGTGSITLMADSGNSTIEVFQGGHEIQAAVTLGTNTDVNAEGGSVDFNNTLNIGTRTLTIESGTANINHSVVADMGGQIINSATLGTAGATNFGGNLTSTGTLHVDIAGTGLNEFDAFHVAGTATLSGLLDVALVEGFSLVGDEMFTVLTADSLVNNGIVLTPEAATMFALMVDGNNLVLAASLGLDGDYNGDGLVNAADYVLWRDQMGDSNGYNTWRDNFGNANGAGIGAAAVPEPSALVLLALSASIWLGMRKLTAIGRRSIAAMGILMAVATGSTAFADAYGDAVMADNPLVWFRLDEGQGSFFAANSGTGGFALDGFYNQFTEVSGPRSQAQLGPRPGDIAGGYLIDGFDAGNLAPHWGPAPSDFTRVEVPDADPLDISTTGLTLEAWLKRDAQTDTGANEGIISKYVGSGNQRSYNLYYDPTPGVIGLALSSSGVNQTAFTLQTTTNIPLGEWTHVAATWVPGQSMHIYYNGQEVANRTLLETQTALHIGTAPLWIGHQFNTASGSTFEGLIDEAAVYDRALTATEILEHFNAATGAFVGTFTWNVNASGGWSETTNWNPESAPNSNMVTVNFGNVITSPQTVYLESGVTAKAIQFENANKYALAGVGTITLEADTGSASISVTQGDHEFQAPVTLASDTNVNVASGSVSFNNVLNLGGNTLNLQSGTVNINHLVIPGGNDEGEGGMLNNAGVLGGEGAVGIGGDFANTGTIEFDLGGTGSGEHDSFIVDGTATLAGSIFARFADGYRPHVGDTFTLLTAGNLIDNGIELTGPTAGMLQTTVMGNALIAQVVAIPEPNCLALLTLGAAVVGWHLRKRK